jgi:hypothetical protein
MIFMKSIGKKITSKYPKVKITWWDICSSTKSWIAEEDILKEDVSVCTDVGYIYKKTKNKLWLFTSYSEDENGMEVGGLTTFPRQVVKKIEVLK